VRLLLVWNPVMEGMITTCTLSTVLTKFIHSIFNPQHIVDYKNKIKIMGKGQNNYYNTEMSDILLGPLLWWVKRQNIYKGTWKIEMWTHLS
jgi:hypothetical protein